MGRTGRSQIEIQAWTGKGRGQSDEEQIVGRMVDTTIDDQALSLRLRHCLSQRLFSLVSDFCHFCSSGHGSRRQCPPFRRWTAGLCLFVLVFLFSCIT